MSTCGTWNFASVLSMWFSVVWCDVLGFTGLIRIQEPCVARRERPRASRR